MFTTIYVKCCKINYVYENKKYFVLKRSYKKVTVKYIKHVFIFKVKVFKTTKK